MAPRKPRLGEIPDLSKPMKVRESLTEELRRRVGEKLEAPEVPPAEAFDRASTNATPSREEAPTPRPEAVDPGVAQDVAPPVRAVTAEPRPIEAAPARREPSSSEPTASPASNSVPRTYGPRPTTPPSEVEWSRPAAPAARSDPMPEPEPEDAYPTERAPEPEPARRGPSPTGSPARAATPIEATDDEGVDDAGEFAPVPRRESPRAFQNRRAFSLEGDPYEPGRYRIKIFDLVKEDFQGKERPVKFTVLDNAWDLMSEEQTPGEQAVYIKLYRMSYGFGNRTCVVSVLDIARKMNIARNTARAYLRGLEEKAHIRELYPEFKNRGKVYWVEFPREYLAKKSQAEGRDRAAKAFETSMAKLKEMGIL